MPDNFITLYDVDGNAVDVPEPVYHKGKLLADDQGSKLAPTARRCTAQAKHKLREGLTWPESRCDNPAVIGWTVCQMHGARGGRPPTVGRYSKLVPSGMGRDIDRFLNDPRILSLKDNIAVSDVHIQELMAGVDSFIDIMQRSLGVRDGLPVSEGELAHARQWERSLKEWMGERRMQAAEERRLLESQSRMMSMDRVTVLIAVLADSVKRNVSDPVEVAAVGRDLASVLGRLTGTNIGPNAELPALPAAEEGEFREVDSDEAG